MMPSPESYVAQFEGRPYADLIAARESLLADLREQEAAFRNPGPGSHGGLCPSPGVTYSESLQRLAALCDHMARHAQALTGEPDLYADEEGDEDAR